MAHVLVSIEVRHEILSLYFLPRLTTPHSRSTPTTKHNDVSSNYQRRERRDSKRATYILDMYIDLELSISRRTGMKFVGEPISKL